MKTLLLTAFLVTALLVCSSGAVTFGDVARETTTYVELFSALTGDSLLILHNIGHQSFQDTLEIWAYTHGTVVKAGIGFNANVTVIVKFVVLSSFGTWEGFNQQWWNGFLSEFDVNVTIQVTSQDTIDKFLNITSGTGLNLGDYIHWDILDDEVLPGYFPLQIVNNFTTCGNAISILYNDIDSILFSGDVILYQHHRNLIQLKPEDMKRVYCVLNTLTERYQNAYVYPNFAHISSASQLDGDLSKNMRYLEYLFTVICLPGFNTGTVGGVLSLQYPSFSSVSALNLSSDDWADFISSQCSILSPYLRELIDL